MTTPQPGARLRAPEPSTDPTSDLEPDLLLALATLVEEGLVPDRGVAETNATTIVAAVFDDDDMDLLLKPIDGHPSQHLLGFTAPAEWSCLGVATSGWASTYDTVRNGIPQRTGTDRYRCRVLHVVTRTGAAISIYRDERSEPLVHRWQGPLADHGGLIDDCLRRALDLPSVAAPPTTIELWALVWVDRVLREAVDGQLDRGTWTAVAGAFSAFDFLDGARDDPRLFRWATDHMARAGELLADAYPWSRIREHCRLGTGPVAFSPDLAEWMDDGMFARTILEAMPPLDQVLADLADLLDPAAHRRLIDTIADWGLFALHDAAEAS